MVRSSLPGWWSGRLPSLVAAVALLVGGLALIYVEPAVAQTKKKETDKDKEIKPLPPPKWVMVARDGEDSSQISQDMEIVGSINAKLQASWKQNKVTPSRYATDYEFIRRASLDIIGRIATIDEVREFLNWPEKERRSRLVNKLLSSEEYPRHWANVWANWLLTRSGPFGRGMYHDQMVVWLEEFFAQRSKHYDELVRSLLTAKGKNTENGAVNFLLAHVGEPVAPENREEEGHFQMVPLTSRITRLFLGTQVQCAQCHDHPFYSSIKQEHFWSVNAFLRQVDRKGNPNMMRGMPGGPLELVDDPDVDKRATALFEKRNAVILEAHAEFLPPEGEKHGTRLPKGKEGIERREMLADYIIEHPQFPRAISNRMWGVFLGRGFCNPVDDFNEQNQVSNPELLDELADRFKHYSYDLRRLIRWITHSQAYHLSCVANKTNDKPEHEPLFSRMILKSMSPEQLFESLMVATRSEAADNKASKKILQAQWLDGLIANFGDDEGNEVNFNGTVVQALLMMNGKDINEAISRKEKGTVAQAMARAHTPYQVINELYLAALNRPPTQREVTTILNQFHLMRIDAQRKDMEHPSGRYEDLFWALLNSNEFLLNH